MRGVPAVKKTTEIAYIALSVAMIAVCSWIQIPLVIPVTMQTFAVLTVSALLNLRCSVTAVVVYLLLGLVGVPVFAGFRSGAGILFSPTGGFLIGFFFTALLVPVLVRRFGRSAPVLAGSMAAGLVICYLFGALWYSYCYAAGTAFTTALAICVLPFLIPDGCKIFLAVLVVRRVYPRMQAIGLRHCR